MVPICTELKFWQKNRDKLKKKIISNCAQDGEENKTQAYDRIMSATERGE